MKPYWGVKLRSIYPFLRSALDEVNGQLQASTALSPAKRPSSIYWEGDEL
jgi:hypothetical protein